MHHGSGHGENDDDDRDVIRAADAEPRDGQRRRHRSSRTYHTQGPLCLSLVHFVKI